MRQANRGGGRWNAQESAGVAGVWPRQRRDFRESRLSGETSPTNRTGSIAIHAPALKLARARWADLGSEPLKAADAEGCAFAVPARNSSTGWV